MIHLFNHAKHGQQILINIIAAIGINNTFYVAVSFDQFVGFLWLKFNVQTTVTFVGKYKEDIYCRTI